MNTLSVPEGQSPRLGQQTARGSALLSVLLPDQQALHPGINLPAIGALKPDFLAGREEPANSFQ